MGKLNLNKVSLTGGFTGAILFVLCYVLFLASSTFMYSVAKNIFHGIQLTNQFFPSLGGFILGLIYTFIGSYIITAIFVLVYNNINKK